MSICNFIRYISTKLHRHRLTPKHRHHPPHRPHKPLRLSRPPVHVLRPIDARQLLRHLRGDHLCRAPPSLHGHRRQILPFSIRHRLQRSDIHPSLLRKRHRRRRSHTVFVSDLHRRPHQLLSEVLLPPGNIFHPNRQPPRRSKALRHRTRAHQPLALQHLHHALLQLRLRPGDHPRRNLFQPNLKQKISHVFYRTPASAATVPVVASPDPVPSSSNASPCAAYALATPTTSVRIRAITPTRSVTEIAPRASSKLKTCEHFSASSYAPITGKRFNFSSSISPKSFTCDSNPKHSASYRFKCSQSFGTSA